MASETFDSFQPPRKPRHIADEALSRWIKISLGLHALVICGMIFKGALFPSNPKPYISALRVDMVALPDMLKKDLRNGAPSQGNKEITEALKRAENNAKNIKPIKIPDQPKEVDRADPDEMVLKPKKAAAKPEPSEDRSQKLQGALARIKALSKISGDEGAKPSPTRGMVVKGNMVSKGTSLSGDARESANAGYHDLVRDRISENWSLPVWLSRQEHSAKIILYIDSRGRVRSFRFVKPSGNDQFDSAVKKAIEDSQPFPAPPDEVASAVQVDGIGFAFPL